MIKDKTYFDKCGNEIMEGDLLEVDHFKSRHGKFGKQHYMYHVVVVENGYYRGRSFSESKTHYNLRAVADQDGKISGSRVLARDLQFVNWEDVNDPRRKNLIKTPKKVKNEQKSSVDS